MVEESFVVAAAELQKGTELLGRSVPDPSLREQALREAMIQMNLCRRHTLKESAHDDEDDRKHVSTAIVDTSLCIGQ